jgi:hypothetical protein
MHHSSSTKDPPYFVGMQLFIQNVNVFPDPVGASVSKSLPLSCVNMASSCQVQGLQPKQAFTAVPPKTTIAQQTCMLKEKMSKEE